MLIVQGEAELPEEGALETVREALQTMVTETRKEPGCIDYGFSVDVCSPTTIRITERWESMEALEAHMKSPHMAAFGAALAKTPPKSMSVKLWEVARELELPR